MFSVVLPAVCADAPAEENCEENLPIFWAAIAKTLFDPERGWFNPQFLCSVIIKLHR